MTETFEKLDTEHHTSELHPAETLRTYYVIFAWLMGLLVLTVLASLLNLDKIIPGLNAFVAMVIAVVKAALVVLFFMHVKRSSKLTWIFASAAFLWLGIMFALSFADYLARSQVPEAAITTPERIRTSAVEHVNKNVDKPVSHD